jgi:hypothetical protein
MLAACGIIGHLALHTSWQIFAKLLLLRLVLKFGDLVSPVQNAFIPK